MFVIKNISIKIIIYFIIIIFWFVFFLPNIVLACSIKNSTAMVLEKYINNNRKVISNITSEISKKRINKEDDIIDQLKNDSNTIIRIFSEAFNWEWFFSSFYYYAIFPITNEMPHEIMRDNNLLEKESEWLKNYLKKIIKFWNSEIIIDNACNWITNYCEFNWNASDIIWKLIKNNWIITSIYRQVVTGSNINDSEIFLVDQKNFIKDLKESYWWNTIPSCSEEWWFMEKIKKAISKITELNKIWEKWKEDWINAWQMLMWTMSNKQYLKEERRILKEELDRQWLPINNQNILLRNLKNYNEGWWFSINNNFLTNTYYSLSNSITTNFNSFEESISQMFIDKKTVSVSDLQTVTNQNDISLNIAKNIEEVFQSQKLFISIEDINTAKTRAKIIEFHNNLIQSSKVLEETCNISVEKVCKKQGIWLWNCWKCN